LQAKAKEATGSQFTRTGSQFLKLCVPILQYHKLIDGNFLPVQANAKAIVSPTPEETAKANQIMKELGVTDHVPRNFGYFQGQLRILDLDSPFAKS